jgi:hypothetical protein
MGGRKGAAKVKSEDRSNKIDLCMVCHEATHRTCNVSDSAGGSPAVVKSDLPPICVVAINRHQLNMAGVRVGERRMPGRRMLSVAVEAGHPRKGAELHAIVQAMLSHSLHSCRGNPCDKRRRSRTLNCADNACSNLPG